MKASQPRARAGAIWALSRLLAFLLLGPGPLLEGASLAQAAQAKEKPAAKPEAAPGESLPDKDAAKAPDKVGVVVGDKPEENVTSFDSKPPAKGEAPAPPPQYDPRLVQLIEQKRADLAVEEARLARERQELLKLQAEVMARIDDLKKVQAVLEELVKTDQEQREGRVQQLVKMLSNMKPDAAGAVVGKLDDQMAVDVFSKMSPRTSGKILATLKPDHAARIGELLTRTQQSREAAKLTGEAAAAGTQPPGGKPPLAAGKPPAPPPAEGPGKR